MNHDHDHDKPDHDHGPGAHHAHGPAAHDAHSSREHGHTHGAIDASILTSERGIAALRWSFVVMFATALIQVYVYYRSNSVGLLADTIHNFGDAGTAIPLWIAFSLSKRQPSHRFPYGLGRVEDLAGVAVVLVILFSAAAAGYETVYRFFHPTIVTNLYAVMFASVIGFLGNEGAAVIRIRTGKEIESAALIADGKHARVDGLASLAVLFGALGVKLGYPIADTVVGAIITLIICKVVWESGQSIFTRMLDGVEPELIPQLTKIAQDTQGVSAVGAVRARWLGHRLIADLTLAVPSSFSVGSGHEIAKHVQAHIQEQLPHVASVTVHVDPVDELGEEHHGHHEH